MKIYRQIAVICLTSGLLAGLVSYGVEGAEQIEPNLKPAAIAARLFNLGQKYSQGEEMTQDDEEAAYYYRKAAELGNARAQIRLGMMYANGLGVQKDFDEAIYWIEQASDLAQLSWHDTAVSEAVFWLQKASEHGYTPARRTLESMKDNEKWGGANQNESIFWFRKSVGLGGARGERTSRLSRPIKQDS